MVWIPSVLSVLQLHDVLSACIVCTRLNKAMPAARMIPGLSDSAVCECVCVYILLDGAAELMSVMRGIPVVETDLPGEGSQ
jgi:hypothetical protein